MQKNIKNDKYVVFLLANMNKICYNKNDNIIVFKS